MSTRNHFRSFSPAVWGIGLTVLGIIATLYRVLQWNQLPPRLATAEAKSGLIAQQIASGHASIGFHAATGFSPLWEAFQSVSILVFGSTSTAIRLVSLIISLATIVTTYGWAKSWYDRRTAYVASFLMAVVPWSVTISRNGLPTVLAPLLITSILWSLTSVMRIADSKTRASALIGVAILALLSGPWGWLAALIAMVAILFQRKLLYKVIRAMTQFRLAYIIAAIVLVIASIMLLVLNLNLASHIASAFVFAPSGAIIPATLHTLSMFFYHGDLDFHHNLGSEPMLNAFISLGFVTGLLVTLSRIQRARDRILLILLVLGLVPSMLSAGAAPNAARAALALPAVMLLSSIGIFYLLDLWSATFPVNSAARTLGITAISLLLFLTAFQGYTQYFTAWANSNETYIAYNRAATAASAFARDQKDSPTVTLVGEADELPVASYFLQHTSATIISASDLESLATGLPRHLILTASTHDAAVLTLAKRFPGGTIKPHLDRDGTELFYDYVISK